MSIEQEYLSLLEEEAKYRATHKCEYYQPSPKQKEFHNASGKYRQRLFMAANQSGKSYAGAMEVCYHATGLYPDWWAGKRFDKPTKWWVAGETGETTRDSPQRLLFGEIGNWGTGAVPKDRLGRYALARGTSDLIDHIDVKHVSGGWSKIFFKFYGKGRKKWQGDTVHGIWFDEEPEMDVYKEGLTRTNFHGGLILVTFTPLLGLSNVVLMFWRPDATDKGRKDRTIVNMTLKECGLYTDEQIETLEASYEAYERDVRTKGIPIFGSGRVFPIAEERITCEPLIKIPEFWPRIIGMDFGWGDHPTTAVSLAQDPESKKIYLYDTYKSKEVGIAYHASHLRRRGKIPIAWPHDGHHRDKKSGVQVRKLYQDEGLKMLSEHAQYPDGRGNGLEASVAHILDMMRKDEFKVYSTCGDWLEEFRTYHRKDGVIVSLRDDLMSATRYGIMMIRYAQAADKDDHVRKRYENKPRRSNSWMIH